jgi:hypothetical protein
MTACPKCGGANIINLDIAVPPVLFECAKCNIRFHAVGFTPSEIDANQSLNFTEQATLNALLKR